MLKKLFGNREKKSTDQTVIVKPALTPDISRVIKTAPKQEPAPVPPISEDTPDIEVSSESGERVSDEYSAQLKAEAAVEEMSGQFERWMSNDLKNLSGAWEHAQTDPSPDAYRAIFTAAHNIRGVAGSYGYPAISRLAGSLCTLLSRSRPGENSALINLHVEACRAAHKSIGHGDGANSVADAVCEALEERVAKKTGSENA